ncbi:MAG: peptidoglycan-binding protein [Deltaproteobacteria bacterium]|nr:peptidoglycan-binding protein [Deltaproteobacteria bacterium]
MQYLLRNRYGASLDVTGQFGPTTEDRVLAFQKSVCLGETGVVGRYTWNALVARRSFCTGNTQGGAAQRLLDHNTAGRIELWNQTFGKFDGADPLSNIRDTAAGKAAKTSCYGTAPCTTVRLATGLVNGMAALREQYGYSYFVTAISGASHSATSYHYAGRAVDFGTINGVVVSGDSTLSRNFMQACRNLGAIEVLGPSNDPNHQDHVHCAW